MSINLVDKSFESSVSNFNLSVGYIGVSLSKDVLPTAFSGFSPFIFVTCRRA